VHDESLLIERAKRYDPKAISELYNRHVQSIYRYIYYRVGDVNVAEDLTADVFLRALEASQQGHERAKEALEKEKPGQGVKTKSPVPTQTPRPPHAPKPTRAPGEEGQGPASTPTGQVHGPSATPPTEPPGQSGEEHGPPDAPPGPSRENHDHGGEHEGGQGKGKDKGK